MRCRAGLLAGTSGASALAVEVMVPACQAAGCALGDAEVRVPSPRQSLGGEKMPPGTHWGHCLGLVALWLPSMQLDRWDPHPEPACLWSRRPQPPSAPQLEPLLPQPLHHSQPQPAGGHCLQPVWPGDKSAALIRCT